MTRVDVVTMGEAMMALRWSESMALGRPAQTSIAGAESNVAICLARLEHSVSFVGRVGDDQPGELVMRTLRAERVGTEHVFRDAEAGTGIILFDRPVAGSVNVTYRRRGSAGSRLQPADIAAALENPPRILHVTGVTLALGRYCVDTVTRAIGTARETGCLVAFDVNFRSTLWSPEAAAAALAGLRGQVDIAVGSPAELALMAGIPDASTDQAARKLLAAGAREVVAKLGPRGAEAHTAEGVIRQPAAPVTEVDPVGAGDAFVAGYLSAHLDGLDLPMRLERGNLLGAAVVASHGDWEGAPRRRDLSLVPGGAERVHR